MTAVTPHHCLPAEVEWLAGWCTGEEIAAHTGHTRTALYRAMHRAGRPDVAAHIGKPREES